MRLGVRLGRLSILGVLAATFAPDVGAQRWSERPTLTPRRRAGMVLDELRGRVVLYGGITGRGTSYSDPLAETWEWDHQIWTKREGLAGQPGQIDNARGIVWDSVNLRVLLLDWVSAAANADFWTWQGRTWTRITTTNRPNFRQHFAAAFDPVRQRYVMWGGSDATGAQLDVWEYNGTDWVSVGGPGPTGRNEPALAYDGVRGRIVMYGGRAVSGQVLNDMWQWDGLVWSQITPATLPPARNGHSMTWDPVRRRVVLFGGGTGTPGTVMNDTWEWDGTNWARVTTQTAPPARTAHAAAYHADRNRLMIACGEYATGLYADTWEYDGTNWVETSPADAPAARADHAAVYDGARNQIVLFGGRDAASVARGETWLWRGTRWTMATPAATPTPRFDHAMAFDGARGNVVLFGGFATGGVQNDTWLWDGTNWTMANPTTRPSARYQHAMAFDSSRGRVVLFGGTVASTALLNDTWEWDGTNWQQLTPTTSPLARSEHMMVFDAARNLVVMFGGRISASTFRQDTWTFDGTTWTDRNTSNVPIRGNSGMDYDPLRQRVVLACGKQSTSGYLSTSYEWNGSAWTQPFLIGVPAVRGGCTLTWDGSSRRMLLFGGENATGKRPDTWCYTTIAEAKVESLPTRPACYGPNPAAILGYDEPVPGNSSFALDFAELNPPTLTSPVFFLLSLNQAPNGVMFGPCQLDADPSTLFFTSYTLLQGTLATLPLPVPLSLNLIGGQFYAQCLHLDPPTALNGIAFSVGARVTIGDF